MFLHFNISIYLELVMVFLSFQAANNLEQNIPSELLPCVRPNLEPKWLKEIDEDSDQDESCEFQYSFSFAVLVVVAAPLSCTTYYFFSSLISQFGGTHGIKKWI